MLTRKFTWEVNEIKWKLIVGCNFNVFNPTRFWPINFYQTIWRVNPLNRNSEYTSINNCFLKIQPVNQFWKHNRTNKIKVTPLTRYQISILIVHTGVKTSTPLILKLRKPNVKFCITNIPPQTMLTPLCGWLNLPQLWYFVVEQVHTCHYTVGQTFQYHLLALLLLW